MILDKLTNLDRYKALNQLNTVDVKVFQKGKNQLGKEDFFSIGLEYETKAAANGLWEAHRKYMDVHVVLEGEELIYISDIENCQSTQDYDQENDYELFESKQEQVVKLTKGMFLCLYPNEVHKTSIFIDGKTSKVKKNVFKICL